MENNSNSTKIHLIGIPEIGNKRNEGEEIIKRRRKKNPKNDGSL